MANINQKQFEILDCTIRDGGYVNNWDFDKRIVKDLYKNLSRAGVDIIEIGFRNISHKKSEIWQSTSEELIQELFSDVSGAKIALMLDYVHADLASIPDKKESLVNMYRVACHKDKILDAISLCNEIKTKGYLITIQIMGIVGYSQEELEKIVGPLSKSKLDYIYFADSYGSLFPKDIRKYVECFKPTNKKIGFHPHNGLQLAFANTLEAINCGVDIVDGTVYGMGRGAGNLPIEVLITYLEKTLSHERYNSIPILDLIDRYFLAIKKETDWGYCLPYMLSGIFEVHPNYAKQLTDYHEHSMDDMVKALEIVKNLKPVGFDKKLINDVIANGFVKPLAEQEVQHDEEEFKTLKRKYPISYKDRHKGKDFLVLGNGPSLQKYKGDIDVFIDRYDPVIMGANFLGDLFVPHYHAFSNKKRFINYVGQVKDQSKLLLSSSFDEDFINGYSDKKHETIVHLNRAANSFDIKDDVVTSNCRTVSILLIAVAIIMGAKRIFIAGMDGYKKEQGLISQWTHFYKESEETENIRMLIEKHDWNERLLYSINSFLTAHNRETLHIVTPTSHKYHYNSIYNWIK